MEGPRDRREKAQGADGVGPADDPAGPRPEGQPPGKQADPSARPQDVKKVKVSLSLPEDFARRLNVVAASLGVDPCDLVVRALWPMLRSCRMATISNDLKALFPRESAAAG